MNVWIHRFVTLATIDKDTRRRIDGDIEALTLQELLAVHLAVPHEGTKADWQQDDDGVYAVTHIPTGMRIASFPDMFMALSFAEKALMLPAPWDSGDLGTAPVELLPWGEALRAIYREIFQ